MINKNLDAIDKRDFISLVSNQVAESRTLEYKEKLPGGTDDEKKELLADISSFANASGGDIIYGLVERRDSNGKTTGLPAQALGLSGINTDTEIRRLESILQDGLDPRLPGLRIRAIDGFPDGPIIIIRVPKSWNSPHMVVFKSWSRFFARNSAGKYQLDVTEIRSTFVASESLAERIRQFRAERIAQIIADETPVPLEPSPQIVLHVLPLESFNSGTAIDVARIQGQSLPFDPIGHSGLSHRYNFDGLCKYSSSSGSQIAHSYAQIFRNGCIESVNGFLLDRRRRKNRNIIPIGYEQDLMKALTSYLELQQAFQLNLPILVMLSLLDVKGYKMAAGWSEGRFDSEQEIDRANLLIPEIFVESYDIEASDVLYPAFDAVWQACGYARSLNYDEAGNWAGRR